MTRRFDVHDRDKQLIKHFIDDFSAWRDVSYEIVRWPDLETRDVKAVDAIARDPNGRELAIEHTLLQPFTADRADTVRFLQVAGALDQRKDLAEPNWVIELIFEVGAIPVGVSWVSVGERLEAWFIEVRSTLKEGRAAFKVDGLTFPLLVTVDKSPLPDTPGRLFVMRKMPNETVEPVLRTALAAKLPKLVATLADERVLLLELESPARGNWEIGQAIEDAKEHFSQLRDMSGIWLAKTIAWATEGYIGFHLIWPLEQVEDHQEWWKARAASKPWRRTTTC